MARTEATSGSTIGVLRDVQRVTLLALAVAAAAVVVVWALAFEENLRAWFGLTPDSPIGVPVAELWLDNARTVLWAFAAAAAATWWPRSRPVLDLVLCAILGGNVVLVAVALGAYGGALLRLAPGHYVLELLAIATAVAAYLDARRAGSIRPPVMVGCAGATGALLLGAAVLESACV